MPNVLCLTVSSMTQALMTLATVLWNWRLCLRHFTLTSLLTAAGNHQVYIRRSDQAKLIQAKLIHLEPRLCMHVQLE